MNDPEHEPGERLTGDEFLAHLAGLDEAFVKRDAALRDAAGDVALQLRIAREFAMLDHREVGLKASLAEAIVAGIERGTHDATRSELEQLGIALGIDFVIGKSSAA